MDSSFQGSSESGKSEWLTPPGIVKAVGPFDLDPCAPISRPWNTAENHLTIEDDGLNSEWNGRVWCNPPYSRATIDEWLPDFVDLAQNVIEDSYELERSVAEETRRPFRVRLMFRSPRYYQRFEQQFGRHMRRVADRLPDLR